MFQSLRWKFHTAPALSPDPPPTDNAAQTATASKVRGRPRGSKNKPKPPLTAASTSSAVTTRPPKKKPRTSSGAAQSSVHLVLGPWTIPPSQPSVQPDKRAQCRRLHVCSSRCSSIAPTRFDGVVSTSPANAHILCVTVIAPYSPASFHNTTSPKHRLHQRAVLHISTIQRARDLGIDTSPSTPPSSTSSPPNPLGLITDSNVDREYDPVSFIHSEGLGEEDEDPDTETAKCEFPAWFTARVDEIRAELTTDMASASARSRYYANGSFWIPRRASSFLLNKTNVKPTDIFACDFFRWDPLNILGTNFNLRCPNPECKHHLTRFGIVQ
ncbi:hypothetical protein B0H14DRAFT_3864848 [Mycena olivaceomarginata]|nr:hypothetical protein B0H14DRAFT_3864848 [Mycena olivaceomarginata]